MRTARTALTIFAILMTLLTGCATQGVVDPRTMQFPPLSFAIPATERVVLENGMVVYLLEDHELPLINMVAYIKTGGIYDPPDKTGLAALTGVVLRSGGTMEMPPEKLDADLEFMASTLESGINTESGTVMLSCLKKNLDRSLRHFAQIMMHPAFREDRVALAKSSSIEGLRRQNDNPKAVADRELRKALYAGHPLGRVPRIETVEKIVRNDLVEFHRAYFHPNNVILAVSGDFRKDDLLTKVRAAFAGWEKKTVLFPEIAEPAPPKPEVLLVRKDVNQSVIRLGDLGIEKNNPDLHALKVMEYILGGSFTSRLVTEIRSNQGLAYSVDSTFDIGRRYPGTFIAQTETKAQSTARTIGLIEDIIAGMTKAPVTDQELKSSKDAIVNSFIFGFAKPEAVVNMKARLEVFNYPRGYLETYRDNISRVGKDDVLRVARSYLRPKEMILLVVGDEKKFDQPLSTFGPVREINVRDGM